MLFVNEGFTFRNFLVDAFAVFIFVVWFWLLITVFSDLFRRHDVSGWVKAIWVIALVVFPYLGIFAYLITMLLVGPWKTQSLISALMLGPLAATVATALALIVYWIVVIEAH